MDAADIYAGVRSSFLNDLVEYGLGLRQVARTAHLQISLGQRSVIRLTGLARLSAESAREQEVEAVKRGETEVADLELSASDLRGLHRVDREYRRLGHLVLEESEALVALRGRVVRHGEVAYGAEGLEGAADRLVLHLVVYAPCTNHTTPQYNTASSTSLPYIHCFWNSIHVLLYEQ